MTYKSKQDLSDLVENLSDDAKLCPFCFTELIEAEGDDGMVLYCPNEMCLNETEYKA